MNEPDKKTKEIIKQLRVVIDLVRSSLDDVDEDGETYDKDEYVPAIVGDMTRDILNGDYDEVK